MVVVSLLLLAVVDYERKAESLRHESSSCIHFIPWFWAEAYNILSHFLIWFCYCHFETDLDLRTPISFLKHGVGIWCYWYFYLLLSYFWFSYLQQIGWSSWRFQLLTYTYPYVPACLSDFYPLRVVFGFWVMIELNTSSSTLHTVPYLSYPLFA